MGGFKAESLAIDGPALLAGLVEAFGFDCLLFRGQVMLEKLVVRFCWCVGHFPWTTVSNCVTVDREMGIGWAIMCYTNHTNDDLSITKFIE